MHRTHPHYFLRVAWLAAAAVSVGCAASDRGGGSPAGEVAAGGGGQIQPGTLTAGAWDDNLNFDYYLSYLASTQQRPGLPLVPRADRMVIDVRGGAGEPLAGATVTVRRGDDVLFRGPAGSDGRVLFFPAWAGAQAGESLVVEATHAGVGGSVPAMAGEPSVALALEEAAGGAPGALDLALVIDTTGSMGDEIEYLKVEVAAIVDGVARRFPGLDLRFGLVAYRDDGDAYVVRRHDFTRDLGAFRAALAEYEAGGGGDWPEALERGLDAGVGLSWRGDNVARVLFHLADAPHHAGREGALVGTLAAARDKGVHVYPVGASGVDDLAEYTLRTEAQVTGGRYLFLTDDSGVGNPHQEPRLPCYLVTKLDAAMRRMIAIELSGRHLEPEAGEVLRTGGDPRDGRCTLDGGQVVHVL